MAASSFGFEEEGVIDLVDLRNVRRRHGCSSLLFRWRRLRGRRRYRRLSFLQSLRSFVSRVFEIDSRAGIVIAFGLRCLLRVRNDCIFIRRLLILNRNLRSGLEPAPAPRPLLS